MTLLNSLWTPIQFTFSYDSSSVDFLDCTLHTGSRFNQSGLLHLQPHYKLTNTLSYLHYSSSHPPPPPPLHVSSGLVKGEMTRIFCLSSDPLVYSHHVSLLISNLSKKGYPKKPLNSIATLYPHCNRYNTLHSTTRKRKLYQDTNYPPHHLLPPFLHNHEHQEYNGRHSCLSFQQLSGLPGIKNFSQSLELL